MVYHPDRASLKDKEEMNVKFMLAGKVHKVLSNEKSRKFYIKHGLIMDEDVANADFDIATYVSLIFPRISQKSIDDYQKQYTGSETELNDIKSIYLSCKGDMDEFVDQMFFITLDNIPRFQEIIQKMIKEKQVRYFKKFDKGVSKAKINKLKREAKEIGKMQQKKSSSTELHLKLLENRDKQNQALAAIIDSFEAKYSAKPKRVRTSKKNA